jgi:hypothetical protein
VLHNRLKGQRTLSVYIDSRRCNLESRITAVFTGIELANDSEKGTSKLVT